MKVKKRCAKSKIKNLSNILSFLHNSTTKVCYVGRVIESKNNLKGPYVCHYYIFHQLQKKVESLSTVDFFSKKKKNLLSLIECETIWMMYPQGRSISFIVLLVTFLFRKKLILHVFDLPVEQADDIRTKKMPVHQKIQFKLLERLLFSQASDTIVSSPGFIDYMSKNMSNKVVFPPGVCEEDIQGFNPVSSKGNGSNKLAYAGSLDRGGMIEKISLMFNSVDNWEFLIAGSGDEHIYHNKNVKYYGVLSYLDVQTLYTEADAIILPYSSDAYYQICLPLKLGEILASCKPIIMLRLLSSECYLKKIGLLGNVIFVDGWDEKKLKDALNLVKFIKIDIDECHEKLQNIVWDKRAFELITFILEDHDEFELKWI
jgi:glycosyltransferase involved in cell wall biosynthesis